MRFSYYLDFLYLNPQHNGFKLLSFLTKYKKRVLTVLCFVVLAFPVFLFMNSSLLLSESEKRISEKQSLLEHKMAIYDAIMDRNRKLNENDKNLTEINDTIQMMAQKYKISIEHLEWNLEKGKSIELEMLGESYSIFHFIDEITKISYLKFHQLTLLRDEKVRKLQLNATLVLSNHKE